MPPLYLDAVHDVPVHHLEERRHAEEDRRLHLGHAVADAAQVVLERHLAADGRARRPSTTVNGKAWCIGSTIDDAVALVERDRVRGPDCRFAMKLRCVSMTPFMPPDVPDVKTIDARSSGCDDASRRAAARCSVRCAWRRARRWSGTRVRRGVSCRRRTVRWPRSCHRRSCTDVRTRASGCESLRDRPSRDDERHHGAGCARARPRPRPAAGRSRSGRRSRRRGRCRSRRRPSRCCSQRSGDAVARLHAERDQAGRDARSAAAYTSSCEMRCHSRRTFCWNAILSPHVRADCRRADSGKVSGAPSAARDRCFGLARRSVRVLSLLEDHRATSPGPAGPLFDS